MQTPRNLKEAWQIVRDQAGKIGGALSALAGSRWLLAILATFALVFGAHLIYAPQRLPSVHGLSLAQAGLPPNLDFGEAGRELGARLQERQSEAANVRGEIIAEIDARAAEDPAFIPMLNRIGFGVALVLLLANMALMTLRRRATRG
jgi:hypothetical protein